MFFATQSLCKSSTDSLIGNIGNALTDFFFEDVGITQTQFNVGQQLLSLGIVLFEIPSNYVLYRVGPSLWLSCQIFAFGLVATFQAFQRGVGAFMATRFLLGMCESGYIVSVEAMLLVRLTDKVGQPGGLYTITRFYKKDETSKRFSIYFIGNMFATATSGIIAYGILHMRGICGLGMSAHSLHLGYDHHANDRQADGNGCSLQVLRPRSIDL